MNVSPERPSEAIDTRRTHDKHVYLSDTRYDEPKEYFKVLFGLAKNSGALRKGSTVCDFGCATGEFLYYLSRESPDAQYIGYDIVPDLLARAIDRVPGVQFQFGSVVDSTLVAANSVDLAFMLGVHSIFDEFETCISNLIRWTRDGGRIFIFGMFNSHPVDVWVKYRMSDDPDPAHREPGWNIFSKASISRFIDERIGVGKHNFTPFEMPFDLAPNPSDPVRTWNFTDARGNRRLTNGLSLLCNLEILQINA